MDDKAITDLSAEALTKDAVQFEAANISFDLEEPWAEGAHAIAPENITLTAKEESIFAFLMEVLQENQLNTTLRVAGGWVRDKLYGKESNDIDIALDDMKGSELAVLINEKKNREMEEK